MLKHNLLFKYDLARNIMKENDKLSAYHEQCVCCSDGTDDA